MTARTRKELTLKEAAEFAYEHGFVGDYYGLDDDDKNSLRELLRRTRWRQSRSSLQTGHHQLYAFHQALKRQLPKTKDPAGLHRKSQHALILSNKAKGLWWGYDMRGDTGKTLSEIADSFEVAAEANEDANNMNEAVKLRKTAKMLRKRIEDERTSRDTIRGMKRRRGHSRKHHLRSSRSRPRRDTSAKKRALISKKIRLLRAEGYPQRQAVAIALRYAGVPRPTRMKTKHLSSSERRTSLHAKHRRGGSWWKRHHKRG